MLTMFRRASSTDDRYLERPETMYSQDRLEVGLDVRRRGRHAAGVTAWMNANILSKTKTARTPMPPQATLPNQISGAPATSHARRGPV